MAEISAHDYETITATCDHCAVTSIFNRLEDIGFPGPYAGESITCLACSETFQVTADIINAKFELFLWDADRQFQSKRYMLAVAALGQAWEAFFAEFVYSVFLWRPFLAILRSPSTDWGGRANESRPRYGSSRSQNYVALWRIRLFSKSSHRISTQRRWRLQSWRRLPS